MRHFPQVRITTWNHSSESTMKSSIRLPGSLFNKVPANWTRVQFTIFDNNNFFKVCHSLHYLNTVPGEHFVSIHLLGIVKTLRWRRGGIPLYKRHLTFWDLVKWAHNMSSAATRQWRCRLLTTGRPVASHCHTSATTWSPPRSGPWPWMTSLTQCQSCCIITGNR